MSLGIELPDDVRIETVVVNNDRFASSLDPVPPSLADAAAPLRPGGLCYVGFGGGMLNFYRVTVVAHDPEDVGRIKKKLLHAPHEEAARA